MVNEYPNIIQEGLPRLPLDREIEFMVKLILGMAPISKTPYRMAPTKLKKLKGQLQDLFHKGFIKPSVFLWGASIMFVKKKDVSIRLCILYLGSMISLIN